MEFVTMLATCRPLAPAIMLALMSLHGATADELSAPAQQTLVYDIAGQNLDSAIKAFVRVSGVQVFFETALTTGRRSMPVKGRFATPDALKTLLDGTGLSASRTDVDAFVIAPGSRQDTDTSASAVLRDDRFLAALQNSVLDALCRDPQTRPGSYKVGLELWIGQDGIIRHSALIGSTQDPERDLALLRNLQGAAIAVSPPSNVPQPLIMRIRPRLPSTTGDCTG
ncbi:MAG: STN domain-containing protein [Bradyrhizobium sp.]|nr:STN domain-containing protein [Bradyrhizobium sp.]